VRFCIVVVVFLVATSRPRQEVGKHFEIRKTKQLTVLTQTRLQLQLCPWDQVSWKNLVTEISGKYLMVLILKWRKFHLNCYG